MTLRDQIAEQALTLPPADRAFLAELLEESLSSNGFATPELAAQWVAEVKRRVELYDRGETRAYDIRTVMQSMRNELEERRSRTAG
ncbi:MAG TPA: addiction module protein [Pirellulales bacterium]|nr:addiction module protein [Pirellulales bacterium]